MIKSLVKIVTFFVVVMHGGKTAQLEDQLGQWMSSMVSSDQHSVRGFC